MHHKGSKWCDGDVKMIYLSFWDLQFKGCVYLLDFVGYYFKGKYITEKMKRVDEGMLPLKEQRE